MIRFLHIALNIEAAPNFPMRNGIKEAIPCLYDEIDWHAHHQSSPADLEEVILDRLETFKPDVTFMQLQHKGVISTSLAQKISERSFLVTWTGDVRNTISFQEEFASHVGLTLFSNDYNPQQLREKGFNSEFLQVGFDHKLYKKYAIGASDNAIVFLANNYTGNENNFPLSNYRMEMIHYLKSTFPNEFKLCGHGWNVKDARYNIDTTNVVPLNAAMEVSCYNMCKIAINLSHFNYSRYSSDRLFRIMGSGAFCLTHRYKDIEMDFKDGVHLVCWDDIPDLIEKCRFWLKPENESKRLKIAEAGYQLVHSEHRWKNRFEELMQIIQKTTNNKIHTTMKSDTWISDMGKIITEKVYSQYGEESYIGYILNNIGGTNRFLVDIGAGDGITLSNTKLLLEQYGWKGLRIDGGYENDDVKKHFVTAENIVSLFKQYEVPQEFDLLSYDTDGNDYWILQKILSEYSPRLIVCEFNGCLPVNASVAIKYNPKHTFQENDNYGFSFKAGEKLAEQFGYRVIFQNNSTNMYLLRKDCLANPDLPLKVTYIPSQYWKHDENAEWIQM